MNNINIDITTLLIIHAVLAIAIIILVTWQHNIIKNLRKKNREMGESMSTMRLLFNSTFGTYGSDVYEKFEDLSPLEKSKYIGGGPVVSDPTKMYMLNMDIPGSNEEK